MSAGTSTIERSVLDSIHEIHMLLDNCTNQLRTLNRALTGQEFADDDKVPTPTPPTRFPRDSIFGFADSHIKDLAPRIKLLHQRLASLVDETQIHHSHLGQTEPMPLSSVKSSRLG